MRNPFGSLRGQLLALILGALVVAQAISLWLFVDERSLAVRAAVGAEAAGRAANVALLLEEAPADLRAAILRAADSPLVRFQVAGAPAVDHLDHMDGGGVEARIRTLLRPGDDREVRVEIHETDEVLGPMSHVSQEMVDMHRRMSRGRLSTIELTLSLALDDGSWLNVDTRFQRPPLQWPVLSALSFGLTAALLLAVVCWFLLTRLTGPLRRLAVAAESFGRGEETATLPVEGPEEIRTLTASFNVMQERLTRSVHDRTRIMAALGHDLRSPLTALRVHAEMIEDDETREATISSIEEMQDMVERTLSFARGMATSEAPETIELGAFLGQLQKSMITGFTLEPGPEVKLRVRPQALRRAVRNLIENSVRYGGTASVRYRFADDHVLIEIMDDGPGIPEDQLEQVFEPFFRLEGSRSRETGGSGLGLSIARTLVRMHGGDVTLHNRPEGGLRVLVTIPVDKGDRKEERNHS